MNTFSKPQIASLLVSHDAKLLASLRDIVREAELLSLDPVNNSDQAIARLREAEHPYGVVLIDVREPDAATESGHLDSIELMDIIRSTHPFAEVILILDGNRDTGLEAMRAGAFDYIDRSVLEQELPLRLRQISEARRLREIERKEFTLEKLADIRQALVQKKSED